METPIVFTVSGWGTQNPQAWRHYWRRESTGIVNLRTHCPPGAAKNYFYLQSMWLSTMVPPMNHWICTGSLRVICMEEPRFLYGILSAVGEICYCCKNRAFPLLPFSFESHPGLPVGQLLWYRISHSFHRIHCTMNYMKKHPAQQEWHKVSLISTAIVKWSIWIYFSPVPRVVFWIRSRKITV